MSALKPPPITTALNTSSQVQRIEVMTGVPNASSRAGAMDAIAQSASLLSGTLTSVPAPEKMPGVGLLLQTVVELGAKTDEGRLILAVTLPWYEIIAALQRDPSIAFQMSPRMWEEMIAGIYSRAGFEEVVLTPRSGDAGRDVIATKRGVGTIRVIEQVKAYGPGRLVDADDVRALLGVLVADGASKGFLTTTSDFAPRLRQDILLRDLIGPRLELVDGTQLFARLQELGAK